MTTRSSRSTSGRTGQVGRLRGRVRRPRERAWAMRPARRPGASSSARRRELRLLPDDLAGLDTVELGCGTAYVSAWLARRGARPVGIDNSRRQLGRQPDCSRARDRVPAPRQRRADAVPRRVVRLRDQRVRRGPVGRPARVGPGGRAHPAPRRQAPRAHQQRPVLPHGPDDEAEPCEDRLRDQFGTGRTTWPDGLGEFHPSARRLDPHVPRRWVRDPGAARAAGPGGRGRRSPGPRLSGRAAGRSRRSGRSASAREQAIGGRFGTFGLADVGAAGHHRRDSHIPREIP